MTWTSLPRWMWQVWLLALLLVGFWLRLTFWAGNVYYTDEFISMLAIKMVAAHGWPILPSGLYYDHGLLYSLLAGAGVALLGFSEQIARWPVVLVGMVTLAVYYTAARRLFDSPLAGLIAVALAVFDESMLKWGVWARMYAQAHLFVLLTTTWLLLSTLKTPSRRGLYLTLLFLAGAVFSHSLTLALLPPLALLLALFTLAYRRDWLRNRRLWQPALLGAAIVLVALVSMALGHLSSTVSYEATAAAESTPGGAGLLAGFFQPSLTLDRPADLLDFFETPTFKWLLYLIGLGLLLSLVRLARRRHTFADVAFLFLALLPLLTIVEMGWLLADEWRQARYMVFLTLPFFLLLGAATLAQLLHFGLTAVARLGLSGRGLRWLTAAAPLLIVIPLAIGWGRPSWGLARARATGDLDTAYAFVGQQWQPGDRLMSEQPAAAYLYLARNDFYANQTSAKVLDSEEDYLPPIDRYTGSPLVDTVARFNAALADGGRVWLVIGDRHLFHYFDPLLRQQIFAQMDFAYQAGSKYVFASRPQPVPLPAEPTTPMSVNFNQTIELGGYHLDWQPTSPQEEVSLGLYWRLLGPPPTAPAKVFVQLVDDQGQVVAQADHFIYEGWLTSSEWHRLRKNGEWLRDSAELQLPAAQPLDNGPYQILVGFYNPLTLERVPVINDTSGQNAAIIELP